MFLIDDKEYFKNIAESNKPIIEIITSLVNKEVNENVSENRQVISPTEWNNCNKKQIILSRKNLNLKKNCAKSNILQPINSQLKKLE